MHRIITTQIQAFKTHIVVDLETLSVKANAGILAIGAVAIHGNSEVGQFYVNINPESLGPKFHVMQETVKWWNDPERAKAKADLQDDQVNLYEALMMFAEWVDKMQGEWIWGYGSDFDVSILNMAYHNSDLKWPFMFYNHRCLRTLCTLHNIKVKREKGVHHNALHDAHNQGVALRECMSYLTSMRFLLDRVDGL